MLRLLTALFLLLALNSPISAKPVTLLVLGDSLSAGLGLEPAEAFPAKLEVALKPKFPELTIINAGVSGDTMADGLARLDWALSA